MATKTKPNKKELLAGAVSSRFAPATDFIQSASESNESEPVEEKSHAPIDVVDVDIPSRPKHYKSTSELKNKKILVPVTAEQKDFISLCAYVNDVSSSEIVRRAIDEYQRKHQKDVEERLERRVKG